MDGKQNFDLEAQPVESSSKAKLSDTISPVVVDGSPSGDLYGEKSDPASDIGEKKSKKGEFEESPVEPAPPPPYSSAPAPAAAAAEKEAFWKTRKALFLAIGLLLLLLILLATLLGVLLSRKHNNSDTTVASTGGSPSATGISSNPTSSFVPSAASPIPSSSARSGDASAPLLNTAISVVNVMNTGTLAADQRQATLVKIFFQDEESFLCEKSSTNGASDWTLTDSGNRIIPGINGTPTAAISSPGGQMPIYVFFINADGILADVVQEQYGGTWVNGSLSQQQFTPYDTFTTPGIGARGQTLSASWCSGEMPIVYIQGKDLELVAFQLSSQKGSNTWSTVPGFHGGNPGISSSFNFASVCMFDGEGIAPVFVNTYNGTEKTGHLQTVFPTSPSNETVILPPTTASLYRPNTPIQAIFGNLASTDPRSLSGYNMSLILFYPLPISLDSLSPNPSLHMLYGDPYSSVSLNYLNWTSTYDIDTGIVPYALGAKALFDPEEEESDGDFSVDAGVDGSMPKSWCPLLMVGEQSGTIVVVYLTEDGKGIKVTDVLGGDVGSSYDAIVATK